MFPQFLTTLYRTLTRHRLYTALNVLGLALGRRVTHANQIGVELVSWYWHFVDVVWVFVFSIVYLFGR